MGAICGYIGAAPAGVLDAMLAAVPHLGDRTGSEFGDGAGLAARGQSGAQGATASLCRDGQTMSAMAGTFAPLDRGDAATLVSRVPDRDQLAKLDGQFAAAHWEADRRRLTLLRDPFGARALYHVTHRGVFYFASELKQLLAIPGLPIEVDPAVLHAYLTFSFVPGEAMPVRGLKRLRPGHIAVLENDELRQTPYFSLHEEIEPRLERQETAVRFIRRQCRDAVARRLDTASEGPGGEVGLFLSGGIDSSGVGVWLKRAGAKVRAFTLDFGAESFETEQARRVADLLEMPLVLVKVDGADIAAIMGDLVWTLDLPFGDAVTGPQYLLAKAAHEAGITTVFNGEGGDQLFGGWTSKPMIAAELYAGLYGGDSREQLYLRSYHRFYGLEEQLYTAAFAAEVGPPGVRRALLAPFLNSGSAETFLNRVRLTDISLKGSHNILPRMCQTAQRFGLDLHAPLFDRALAAASFKLPPQLKLNGACEKYVLKCALQKALPADIVWQRKLGMGVPITSWAMGPLAGVVDELLSPRAIAVRGYFEPGYVDALRRGQDDPGEIRARRVGERIWTLAMLEAWLRIFIDGKGQRPEKSK